MASDAAEEWFSIAEDAPQGRCGLVTEYPGLPWFPNDVCCWRETWNDAGRCVWHAESDGKTVEELRNHSTKEPERLDSANLTGLELNDTISFANCGMAGATFSDTFLVGANLSNANLTRADFSDVLLNEANLSEANLFEASLSAASLFWADLYDTSFERADLSDAFLFGADISKANFLEADVSNTDLAGADLSDASFARANLSDAYLIDVNLCDASLDATNLSEAFFVGSDLSGASFIGANLSDATLSNTNLIDSNFTEANLTDADLRDTNADSATFRNANLTHTTFFGADLRRGAFYGAIFDGTKINAVTTFGDHYAKEIADDSGEYGTDEPSPWDKAAFTYRQIERLSHDSALSGQSRWAYRKRKDVRRREYRRSPGLRNKVRWLKAEGSRWLTNYGDGPWHVVGTSFVVMVLWAFLYPLVGGIDVPSDPTDTDTVAWDVLPKVIFSLPNPLAEFATSLYFSVVTFTTLGYGDLHPATGAAQALATIESFLGALLMALLVFVLGRRTTW